MNLIKNIPGPFLVFLGAVSLSFGGLIVKSFEGSTLWQILFWRSVFFIIVVSIFLIISYKRKIFIALYKSGLPGLIGGIILSIGVSILLLRQQLLVDDKQWLRRMIPHHSTALTTTHKIYNRTNNPRIKKLAKEIIDTQEKEIQLMKSML